MQQNHQHRLQKIVVIVGPTASGKTSLAIELSKLFGGEVISADSRQVYQGLDIGTDKVTQAEMDGIPHHLIDIVDPRMQYTAADFLRNADTAISDIAARGRLPVVAGGTFFYIETLLGLRTLAGVAKDALLRASLETLSTEELYQKILTLDPRSAEHIDAHNRRRLIRAIEIIIERGHLPAVMSQQRYDACIIGITVPIEVLRERIHIRLDKTLAQGLVEETKKLLAAGIPEARLTEIGLEYRVILAHLRGEYSYEEMRTVLKQKICQYAKRQRTWLKRMENIQWVPYDETSNVMTLVRDFCRQ